MQARPVPPKRTLTLERRATRRFFILRPDADRGSQELLYYVLGRYALEHGILLHAVVQMSNHWHVNLTDPRGVAPNFFADVHRTIAMCIKEHRDWDEEVWNKKQTSVIDNETAEAVLQQLAYVMTNPIAAGMVETLAEYPGALTRPEQIGRVTFTVKRPALRYLSNDECWPKTVRLSFVVPQVLRDEHGEAGARRAIIEAVRERADEVRAERAADGLGYLGAEAVLKAPITTVGTEEEAAGELNPTFAVAGDKKAYREKIRKLRAWRAAYAKCVERWRNGKRDIEWPPHTWKMRVLHGVKCAPLPDD